ncbi:SIMPL domain-containing protein [Terriglobus sp.]|uniref:SIMPL domain-containing protein n=1 Tax=Terriglobus sp. TaxID=1889013 RepID=UPI003AFF921C
MNQRAWIAGLAVLATVLLLLLVFSPLSRHGVPSAASGLSKDDAKHAATLITTSASAHRTIDNSAVDISVGVSVAERDLANTQRSLTQKTNTLMGFLKAQQVEHLRTDALSFSPDERYQKSGPDRTVAYNGSVSVSFRTTPEKAAELLSGVLTHGASTISSTVFTPTQEQVAKAHDDLAAEATRTALDQARAMAGAAGGHMLTVVSVNTQAAPSIAMPASVAYEDRAPLARAAQAPIQTAAGDRELSVTVELVAAAAQD